MDFNQLKKKMSQKQPLFIGEDQAFRSAVLIPLVEIHGKWHILFEVRSKKLRQQPGDISFPGGKIDETDLSPLHAAIRETSEELGILEKDIEVLAELSPLVTNPSFVIYPFVGMIEYEKISFNKHEVEEVFTVPLEWLLNYEPILHNVLVDIKPADDFPFHKIMNGSKYQWRTRSIEEWFYEYNQYTIWGLTARILKYFLEILK